MDCEKKANPYDAPSQPSIRYRNSVASTSMQLIGSLQNQTTSKYPIEANYFGFPIAVQAFSSSL